MQGVYIRLLDREYWKESSLFRKVVSTVQSCRDADEQDDDEDVDKVSLANCEDEDEKDISTVPLPAVFRTCVRPDLVHTIHSAMNKNHRQPYAVSKKAGHQTSAESWFVSFRQNVFV